MGVMVASRRDEEKIILFLLISLMFHGVLALLLDSGRRWTMDKAVREDTIEIIDIPSNTADKNRARRQVVETELINETKDSVDKAYLSEKNQVVREQTRAARTAPFIAGRPGAVSKNTKSAASKNEFTPKELSDLAFKPNLKPMGHLTPQARDAAVASSTNDYLKDVKAGAQTLLNTKEYAFFSFYQRVRRQLEQYWEPGLRKRLIVMVAKGRYLASEREHATRLLVTLNNVGNITAVQLEDTSGISDLDQAAVEAFNRAGPFPNPPHGMVDQDGKVRVEWEFILKT
jgi:protein TonB